MPIAAHGQPNYWLTCLTVDPGELGATREDIRLALTKTDQKKGKYSVQIVVDDNKLEKRDRTINEPVQFLVGRNRLRYELVVNWVQKDKVGGYLSIPKDKALAAEKAPAK